MVVAGVAVPTVLIGAPAKAADGEVGAKHAGWTRDGWLSSFGGDVNCGV